MKAETQLRLSSHDQRPEVEIVAEMAHSIYSERLVDICLASMMPVQTFAEVTDESK